MKRVAAILALGLATGLLAYGALYYAGTSQARLLARSPQPELAWLQAEFHIPDAEFARIAAAHRAYGEGCAERCREIDRRNQHLLHLLGGANAISPEIERLLAETATLRAECQKQMLQHAFQISQTMPPAEGRRYLAWIQAQTISTDTHRQMSAADPAAPAPTSHHH
jgi:hypothetical protein